MIHTKPHRATNGVLTSSQCYSAQSKQSLVKHEPTHSWPYQTTHPVTGRTRLTCSSILRILAFSYSNLLFRVLNLAGISLNSNFAPIDSSLSCRDCSDDEANADAIHNVCIKH